MAGGGSTSLFVMMSDNSLWILPAGIAPLAWQQLPNPPNVAKQIALLRAYHTPLVNDPGAFVPVIVDSTQSLYSFDMVNKVWVAQGSDPEMLSANPQPATAII